MLVLLLSGTGAAAWLARDVVLGYGLREAQAQGRERLKLIAATLRMRVERFRYLPDVVARSREIEALFRSGRPHDMDLAGANAMLSRVNAASGAMALFVTDDTGLTIAASNYNRPASFVGHSYAYRPYIQKALAGGFGNYYAVGATTGEPGYFLATPIYSEEARVGAAVVKIDLLTLEAEWKNASELVAVTDEEGIVFLSSESSWHYRTMGALSASAVARVNEQRRYGKAKFDLVPWKSETIGWVSSPSVSFPGAGSPDRRLMVSMPLDDSGWTLSYLADMSWPRRQADIAAVTATLLGLLAMASGKIGLQRRGARRTARLALIELEAQVNQRTSDLRKTNHRLQGEIEERQAAENELMATRLSLTHAEKLAVIGQAFAGMAHEINQPLAALRTYLASTKMLVARKELVSVQDNIEVMADTIDRVSGLTNQLKQLARRDSSDFAEIDLAQSARRVLSLLKFRFLDLGIRVDTRLDETLPIYASSSQLDQVILNLSSNAIEAVRGRPGPRITVEAHRKGDFCVLTIGDNGPGIEPDIARVLFEPFATGKPAGEGLGLGLAMVHRIVSDHRGSVGWAPSALGGAAFHISFVRYEACEAQGNLEAVP